MWPRMRNEYLEHGTHPQHADPFGSRIVRMTTNRGGHGAPNMLRSGRAFAAVRISAFLVDGPASRLIRCFPLGRIVLLTHLTFWHHPVQTLSTYP